MRAQRTVALAAIGIFGLGLTACSSAADKPSSTSKPSATATEQSKKDEGLQLENLGLQNPIDPCLYLDTSINEVRGTATDYIVMEPDLTADENDSVRYCTSRGNKKALVVTSAFDKEGDDTVYDSVSAYFDNQLEIYASKVGAKKGFITLDDGLPTGIVFKTPRHNVIVIEFGESVAYEDGLVNLAQTAIGLEPELFADAKASTGGGVREPSRSATHHPNQDVHIRTSSLIGPKPKIIIYCGQKDILV